MNVSIFAIRNGKTVSLIVRKMWSACHYVIRNLVYALTRVLVKAIALLVVKVRVNLLHV